MRGDEREMDRGEGADCGVDQAAAGLVMTNHTPWPFALPLTDQPGLFDYGMRQTNPYTYICPPHHCSYFSHTHIHIPPTPIPHLLDSCIRQVAGVVRVRGLQGFQQHTLQYGSVGMHIRNVNIL